MKYLDFSISIHQVVLETWSSLYCDVASSECRWIAENEKNEKSAYTWLYCSYLLFNKKERKKWEEYSLGDVHVHSTPPYDLT